MTGWQLCEEQRNHCSVCGHFKVARFWLFFKKPAHWIKAVCEDCAEGLK